MQHQPFSTEDERSLPSELRYHCVERLTAPIPRGYFQPLNRHVELHRVLITAVMQGYLARNIAKPDHAIRATQIHQALVRADGNNLDDYLPRDTSAQSITLIGPSGCGKTTALSRTLNLSTKHLLLFLPKLLILYLMKVKVLLILLLNCTRWFSGGNRWGWKRNYHI